MDVPQHQAAAPLSQGLGTRVLLEQSIVHNDWSCTVVARLQPCRGAARARQR